MPLGCIGLVAMGKQEDQIAAVLSCVKETGIETLRICFVDQHGILRGKTIVADALPSAFEAGIGIPSTLLLKDTSHRTVFDVWNTTEDVASPPLAGAGDVIIRPDPARFFPLSWSPHSAIILCDVFFRNGDPVPFAPNTVLNKAINELDAEGYNAIFGLEVEFQVYSLLDGALAHDLATMPPAPVKTENLTQGYQYLTETQYAQAEDTLDALRRNAQALGLKPRTMEIEMGPSQFEFTFAPSDPATIADRFVMFRTMVKEVCRMRGLHASFMAKPKLPNAAANGWHIHQSLIDKATGQNAFMPQDGEITKEASAWIAGLLDHAFASCLLTNPTVNSYKRFTPFQLAPNRIQWGRDNRGAMVRELLTPGDPASRIENRVADTTANPHYAFAAQIFAGLAGLKAQSIAPPATETPYDQGADELPQSLLAAITAFEASPHIKDCFGAEFRTYIATLKRAEWDRYLAYVSEWEQQEYFGLF